MKDDQTVQAQRIGELRAAALQVIADPGAVECWLTSPNRALGNVTPLSLLDTDTGLQLALRELAAIEHGLPI